MEYIKKSFFSRKNIITLLLYNIILKKQYQKKLFIDPNLSLRYQESEENLSTADARNVYLARVDIRTTPPHWSPVHPRSYRHVLEMITWPVKVLPPHYHNRFHLIRSLSCL